MNNTMKSVIIETAMAAAAQSKMPKEQSTDDGKFMNMLSDAMNSKQSETAKSQKTETESSADTATESEQPLAQENPETEVPVIDQDDGTVYEEQPDAVVVSMQMQGMFPFIAELPPTEVPDELSVINQVTGTQTVQAGMTVRAEEAAADEFQTEVAQSITGRETKVEAGTAERPQTAEAAPETEETLAGQTKPETTAPRTARTEESAPDMQIDRQTPQTQTAQAEQRPETVRQRPGRFSEKMPRDVQVTTDASGETDAPVRQSGSAAPLHHMRNQVEPEAAQAKFDGMLERATRELNQTVAVQEVRTEPEAPTVPEMPKETPNAERPVTLEAKPQEEIKQAETPKAESRLPEEAKPAAEQAAAQKSVKVPVTDQRPQKEISEADETLFGMTQQKAPEIQQEIIRSEPAPQPQHPVKTPDQAEQIKAQVIQSMENERTEFQMQLQPEELGKVNVKMILEGGKLSVEIAAINPKSVEMLSRQADSLAASLRASGADVSSVSVVEATGTASSEMNGEYNLNNFQNRFRNGENGQGQNGRSKGTGETGEQDGTAAQAERENPKTPQRILNYSV